MNDFQEIIQFLVSGPNPITNINEIAAVMCVAPATVYGYRNQGTEPKFSQLVALNKFLVEQKDCYVIENVFRPSNNSGSLYGKIQTIKKELAAVEKHIIK